MTPETISSTDTGRVHQHNGTILVRAAECIGVDVSDKDVDYFKVASRLAAYVDDMVDTFSITPDIDSLMAEPEEHLGNYLNKSDMQTVTKVLADLPDERRNEWLKAEDLARHSDNKRSASSIYQLKDALIDESMLFKNIFSLDPRGHDALERQTFNNWLTHFSKGGYFVDAAVDLKSDFAANRVSVRPTTVHKAALSGWALEELRLALKITRSTRFLFELGKTASATLLEARRS
jgi:hypothetical protein